MKKYTLTALLTMLLVTASFGQGSVITLKFTAASGAQYRVFDSLKIMNVTRGGDTTLHYPDTTIILGSTAIPGTASAGWVLHLSQNYPNPMNGSSEVQLFMPHEGVADLKMTDSRGIVLGSGSYDLQRGTHRFTLNGHGNSWFILTASSAGQTSSIKVVNSGKGKQEPFGIDYKGKEAGNTVVKSVTDTTVLFTFRSGDSLLYIGYSDTLQTGLYDRPQDEHTVTFRFDWGIPCAGMPTVEYEGVTYHTVQIFNQCWMKENLNAGTRIDHTTESSNNSLIEKYCYVDVEDSCGTLGAFYQWNEMMNYATAPGVRGICPPGWHIPTDDDWKILEGVSDSLYHVGDTTWDNDGVRGVTAGFTLKSPYYWANDGNGSDLFGFTVVPSGYRDSWGYIYGFEHASTFWTANRKDAENGWTRGFGCHGREVSRFDMPLGAGYSVRCIRD